MKTLLRYTALSQKWILALFNSPPREDLTFWQKLKAIFGMTLFILFASVVAAALMTGTLVLVHWLHSVALAIWRSI